MVKNELREDIVAAINEFLDKKPEYENENEYTLDKTHYALSAVESYCRNKRVDSFTGIGEVVDLMKHRVIIVNDIDEESGDIMDGFIRFWNSYDDEQNIDPQERTPIKVLINSNGGNLGSAFTAIDAIENSLTPVWTVNVGKAFSAGFLILLCGHKRFGYKHAQYMFHEGSIQGELNLDGGKFDNYADHYRKIRERIMKNYILARTKISEEVYAKHAKDDWWFFGDEALENGCIDEIITKDWYLNK